ncbi:hypothetical protein SAMD00019534_019070 [Acytostelium subglobosum LB1]|uniref:hypothetical protein n=1 Tax=Acytostelium subglobosum LB1 TaxID=1410327 RepID=UPI0006450454|nr:hypothetical protein SAMD00019534_019070 [Acytostelium subglobosum LB1]GAM18732.1 hypothetical protein SAMD00019534_019070 [Acytostelium subglobosum LB1]|eukprot:XP_012757952.1 hypothetical protein SAMD00019534_019070 [Acytostelium subglobosum LB1]
MTVFSWISNKIVGNGQQQSMENNTNSTADSITFDTESVIIDDEFDDDDDDDEHTPMSGINNKSARTTTRPQHWTTTTTPIIQNFISIPKDNSAHPLEIIFSFDTTGRMFSYFERIRSEMANILASLFQTIPQLKLAFIAHGDYCDDQSETRTPYKRAISILPFTSDRNEILTWLNKIERTDGGDAPELYEYVLRKIRELPWSECSKKAVVMFGDDVPHPPSFTDQHFYWRNELHYLTKIGVRLYGIQCRNNMHAQLFYEELAGLSGGRYIHLKQVDHIGQLMRLLCLRENGKSWLGRYVEDNQALEPLFKTTFASLFEDVFVRQRDTINVRFSWWDISNDIDPNPTFLWNERTGLFEQNVANVVPPKKPLVSHNRSTVASSKIPLPTFTPYHPTGNGYSSYSPMLSPSTPYALHQRYNNNNSASVTRESSRHQAKIGVLPPRSGHNNSASKRKFEEYEQEDDDASSVTTSDNSPKDIGSVQNGAPIIQLHKKDFMFLEKPPKPSASLESIMMSTNNTDTFLTTSTSTSTSTTTTTSTNNQSSNHSPKQRHMRYFETLRSSTGADQSPPMVGHFIALRSSSSTPNGSHSSEEIVVGRVVGLTSDD